MRDLAATALLALSASFVLLAVSPPPAGAEQAVERAQFSSE